jgi:hypothetical protein
VREIVAEGRSGSQLGSEDGLEVGHDCDGKIPVANVTPFIISNLMRNDKKIVFGAGCLVSVMAPITGIVLYPRANWLFAFVGLGIALILFSILRRKGPTPQEVAERAERLLNGSSVGWDVDDYEHLRPKEPELRDLWRKTMTLGGLPEEWVQLDDARKRDLEGVIRAIRELRVG